MTPGERKLKRRIEELEKKVSDLEQRLPVTFIPWQPPLNPFPWPNVPYWPPPVIMNTGDPLPPSPTITCATKGE